MKATRTTIHDVAKAAGVSITTVSDVVNERTRVAVETAAHVRDIIAHLNYIPRPDKRRRVRRRDLREHYQQTISGARQIAVLAPETRTEAVHTPIMDDVAAGAAGYLAEYEHELITATLNAKGELPLCVKRRQVDGVIIGQPGLPACLATELQHIPCVTLYEMAEAQAGDLIAPDHDAMGALAADYLHAAGFNSMVCLNTDGLDAACHRSSNAFEFRARQLGVYCRIITLDPDQSAGPAIASLAGQGRVSGLYLTGYTDANPLEDLEDMLDVYDFLDEPHQVIAGGVASRRFASVGVSPERIGLHAAEQIIWRMAHRAAEPRDIRIKPVVTEPNDF